MRGRRFFDFPTPRWEADINISALERKGSASVVRLRRAGGPGRSARTHALTHARRGARERGREQRQRNKGCEIWE